MKKNDFTSILDVSTIIWDKEDYELNKHRYFSLLDGLSNLLDKLERANTLFLLRNELLAKMVDDFPYNEIPRELWASGNQVLHFLGSIGTRLITYDDDTSQVDSIPNLFKSYFSDEVKGELSSLLVWMHRTAAPENKFFTLSYVYESDENLITNIGGEQEAHQTIIADSANGVEQFLEQYKLKFEHHSKHDKSGHNDRASWEAADDKDNFPSQLSCFDRSQNDPNKRPQELLDNKFDKSYGNDYFYSYDDENRVYVVFRLTEDNIYHAYDMYDINRVPDEVKKHFNVWKYK